jgi:glycosyltransferase involved in cell wall biosynthesis
VIRLAALLAAGALAPVWPAPPNPMALTRQAGLTPETHEFVFLHVHSHLDVFVDGKKLVVPAGIGIDIHAPAVRRFKEPDGSTTYGGINPPCAKPCISPLHTHSHDGVLHTEAKKNQFNRLGQFFKEWNVRLTAKCIGTFCKPVKKIMVYVDGKRWTGDPRFILLKDKREIAIVIGKPPGHIPSKFP